MTRMASFGVDIWNPMNVGSHSTDEQSRDQRVKRKVVYVRVGMRMDTIKLTSRLVVKLRERPLKQQHTPAQL